MVLGEARHLSGDIEGARMEWRTARVAFDAFGAVLRAEQAERLIADAPTHSTTSQTSSEATAVFRCDGDTRTIGFDDDTTLMRNLKGLRYVERLLADPGREIHVLDLVAVERGSLPTGGIVEHSEDLHVGQGSSGLEVIDDVARDAYRRRLAEVDDDIEEATTLNDLGRMELAQRDREYLIAELTSAVGFGGRTRSIGGSAERARTSVTRSLRSDGWPSTIRRSQRTSSNPCRPGRTASTPRTQSHPLSGTCDGPSTCDVDGCVIQLSGRPVSGSKKCARCVLTPSRRFSPLVTK